MARIAWTFVAALLVALPLSACSKKDQATAPGGGEPKPGSGGAKEPGTGGAAKPVEGCNSDLAQAIEADFTFTAKCSPYTASADLSVDGWTLTVEPGVEIKFKEGVGLEVGYTKASKLVVKGTPDKPVRLVAARKEGGWRGIKIYAHGEGSSLEYLALENAGANDQAALAIEAPDVSVKGLAVVAAKKTALSVTPGDQTSRSLSDLDLTQAGGDPDELVKLSTSAAGALGASNKYPEKTVITLAGPVARDVKLAPQAVPYRIIGEVSVEAPEGKSASLTFEAGTKVQMSENAALFIGYGGSGALKIAGTAEKRVVFTRYGEDPKTTPWKGIVLYSHARAPQIEHALFEYVGRAEEPALKYEEAIGLGSVTNCTFRAVAGDAVMATAGTRARFTAFDGNTFEDVAGAALAVPLNLAHGLGAANKLGDKGFVRITGSTHEDTTLKAIGARYHFDGEISVEGAEAGKSATLTVEPGAALSFPESGLLAIGYAQAGKLVAKATPDKAIRFFPAVEGQKWQGLAAYANATLELENCSFASVAEEKPAIDVQADAKGSLKAIAFKDAKVGVKNCGKVTTAGLKMEGGGKAEQKCE